MDLNNDWASLLHEELNSTWFLDLCNFVEAEYNSDQPVYPNKNRVFQAFNLCALQDVRVVILGQDPYHGPGQADGLSFSVPAGVTFPPSLRNIFKELKEDVDKEIPFTGSLSSWAEQGVLLLNATLSVAGGKAGSHQNKGWEKFTDEVIQKISESKQDVVFMLWGAYARKKVKLIDAQKHLILESGHPSPLSANRGLWFGNKHFSKCNHYLVSHDLEPIEW